MEYIAKLRLNERQYLAVLDKALVIVTEDANGQPVRWAIFQGTPDTNAVKENIHDFLKKTAQ